MKILFQGDSITDAGRDRRNYHDLGNGYAKIAAKLIKEQNPDTEFEFINFGISANRTGQLFDRLYYDTIIFEPDIVSILIGVNDLLHRHDAEKVFTSDEQIELTFRSILKTLRARTNAKIMVIAPYCLSEVKRPTLSVEIPSLQAIVRKVAEEYADVYVPLNEYFDEAMKTAPDPYFYSTDGVHPNENGAEFIGKIYAEAIKPLLK